MGFCFNAVNPDILVNGLSVLTSTFLGAEVVLIGVKLATLTLVGGFAAFNVLRAAGFTGAVLALFNVLKAEGLTAATVGLFVLKAPVKLALVVLTLVTGLVKDVALFNKPVAVDAAAKPVPTTFPASLASTFKPLVPEVSVVSSPSTPSASKFELDTKKPTANKAFPAKKEIPTADEFDDLFGDN